jgi:hypothetical protein
MAPVNMHVKTSREIGDQIDGKLDEVTATVTLGLATWAWIIHELPDNDEVTKGLRKQIRDSIDYGKSVVLSELFK